MVTTCSTTDTQINGVDLADTRHDQAVSLLTGIDRVVTLVVYRENLVPKGAPLSTSADEAGKSPGQETQVQRLPHMTQPLISWSQGSSAVEGGTSTHPHPPHSPEPSPGWDAVATSGSGEAVSSSPGVGSTEGSSPVPSPAPHPIPTFSPITASSAHPASSAPFVGSAPEEQMTVSGGGASSPPVSLMLGGRKAGEPLSLSPEWSSPPSAVHPPRFVYPGPRPFSVPVQVTTTTAADTTTTTTATITTTTTTSASVWAPTSAAVINVSRSLNVTPTLTPTPSASEADSRDKVLPGYTVAATTTPYTSSAHPGVAVSDSLVSQGVPVGGRDLQRVPGDSVSSYSAMSSSSVSSLSSPLLSSPSSPSDVPLTGAHSVEVGTGFVHIVENC